MSEQNSFDAIIVAGDIGGESAADILWDSRDIQLSRYVRVRRLGPRIKRQGPVLGATPIQRLAGIESAYFHLTLGGDRRRT
jgi:hypothetical protein